jgi:ABC-2 type transport system permease protein
VKPSHWYVASYLATVIAAIGLVMVPVHVASYRERGVLRRFAAAGFPRWSFAVAEVVSGVVLTVAASVVLLAVTGAVYGIPPIVSPVRAIAGIFVGALAFTSLGLLIGAWMPNARAAQGVGLLLFFPSFLLGGGGPPPSVMGSTMRSISQVLPLTQVTESIRNPWLGLGTATGHLVAVVIILLVSVLGWRSAVQLESAHPHS